MLIHLCGGKTWSSDRSDKGGHEAGGGARPGSQASQPCFMCCPQGPRRTWVCSSFTVFPLHCPGAPSPLLGCLTQTAGPLGGRGAQGGGPPSLSCPAPTQSPLSLDTRDQLRPLLSIHGHPASMGRPVPGASSRPPGPAQSGALTRFLPKDARVCGPALNHRYKLRPWCFIQTPKSSPHFYRERRSLL